MTRMQPGLPATNLAALRLASMLNFMAVLTLAVAIMGLARQASFSTPKGLAIAVALALAILYTLTAMAITLRSHKQNQPGTNKK